MNTPAAEIPEIEVVPPDRQREALQLLFRGRSREDAEAAVRGLLEEARQMPECLGGLLMARRGADLVGATMFRQQPGKTALVWPPQLQPSEPAKLASRLLEHAVQLLETRDVCMAQALLGSDSKEEMAPFLAAGFEHLTDLLYLVAGIKSEPTAAAARQFDFEPYSPQNQQRLAELIEQTYQDTLDCPQLNGIRDVNDVLQGYRATGVFDPARWLIVREHDEDIGCLLLTDHPDAGQWELIYFGLVPSARGKGYGLRLVRHAQWLARCAGVPRMVLAVDVANSPALRLYAELGFIVWDRRTACLRVLRREA